MERLGTKLEGGGRDARGAWRGCREARALGVGGPGLPESRLVLASWQVLVVRRCGLHGELRNRSVAVYRKTLPYLDPPAERLEIAFEGGIIPGNLRRPAGSSKPPLVLLVPGLDSSKEELFAIEDDFLRRGLATLTIDGPGQSENSLNFAIRPNWETVITPLLDHLAGLDIGVDQDRVDLLGISMGAIYGPRAAAYETRIKALVALAGPYNLGECWDALNPLTKGGYVFYTKSADEAEAKRKAYTLNLEGILGKVTQPLLVVQGAKV